MPEEIETLTLDDYLAISRTFAWTASHTLFSTSPSDRADLDLEISMANHALALLIDALDRYRGNFSKIPVTVGLPPNPALIKLARIILRSHDRGTVSIGASTFAVKV
jgi:hypothetical protein